MKILLMGNPNVGKSVVFSRLTGVRVIASNYPGTTVGYTSGKMKLGDDIADVIDVPGAYTLEPTSEAEEVALKMLDTGDVVINVVNATNLERNLYLTLQLLEKGIPVIVALNMWDDTKHYGINIDLGKKVVTSVGYGLREVAMVLPPIFILLGLIDVWVSRERMIRLMGPGSGIKGIIISIIMGSVAAGPLYAAFPIAAMLLKKGARLTNILIFIGAWSTTKIPMLLFEISALGARFALLRLLIVIPGIIIIAYSIYFLLSKREISYIHKKMEEMDY